MPADRWTRRPLKSRDTRWAARTARILAIAGVRPNRISIASVAAAAVAAYCLIRAWYPLAALFILLRLLCNLMDGMVAIEGGLGSPVGEIYNDLPDRLSDVLILCAAGYSLAWPTYAHELGWIAAMLAVLTAYIRILGGACGLTQDFRGPMAKPARMARDDRRLCTGAVRPAHSRTGASPGSSGIARDRSGEIATHHAPTRGPPMTAA